MRTRSRIASSRAQVVGPRPGRSSPRSTVPPARSRRLRMRERPQAATRRDTTEAQSAGVVMVLAGSWDFGARDLRASRDAYILHAPSRASSGARGKSVKRSRFVPVLVLSLYIAGSTSTDVSAATTWQFPAGLTNVVASSPTSGGGYPVPPGRRVPDAGTCRTGPFNANHSESWIALKPGTEDLVGSAKSFFDKYSTFYMFYLGAYQIPRGTPAGNNQIQGYDCASTGTQAMPPSGTDTTDPNVDFDTQGRGYQSMLPLNPL